MRVRPSWLHLLAGAAMLASTGCDRAPGYPRPGSEIGRPDEVLDFHTLYGQNCSGCHGQNGRGGAALPLNNPAYLAIAGADNLRRVTANSVKGTLMPSFAQSAGGMLTDRQIDALVQGMLHEWAQPAQFNAISLPPFSANTPAGTANGQQVFVTACARCHGSDGRGILPAKGTPQQQGATAYSIVDPDYLTLISDQGLRSVILAAHPEPHTPDWRSYISSRPLTAQEVTDIVAWITSHRPSLPSQQTANPPGSPVSDRRPETASPGAAGKEKK